MRTTRLLALLAAFAAFSAFGSPIKWWDKSAEENLADIESPNITNPFATANEPRRGGWGGKSELDVSFSNNPVINDGNTTTPFANYVGDRIKDLSFRVVVLSTMTPLDIYFDGETYDGTDGMSVIGVGGYDYAQISQWIVDDSMVSDYFVVELGMWDGYDPSDEWSGYFSPFAWSDTMSYQQLVSGKHLHDVGSTAPPNQDWVVGYFSTTMPIVPEPSTAILAILGTFILMKRRKQ